MAFCREDTEDTEDISENTSGSESSSPRAMQQLKVAYHADSRLRKTLTFLTAILRIIKGSSGVSQYCG